MCLLINLIGPFATKSTAQIESQEIQIWFFSGLSDQELNAVNKLADALAKKNQTPIFLQNAYTANIRFKWNDTDKNWVKTEESRLKSIESLQINPTNLTIKDGLELESISKKFEALVMVQTDFDWYRDKSLVIPIEMDINSPDWSKALKKLPRQVRREQKEYESLTVIFANAPIPYLRSFESFSSAFKAKSGDSEFIPQFGSNSCDVTTVLKPQGELYVFSFEGSRFFDAYEVELYEAVGGVPELIRTEVLIPDSDATSKGWRIKSGGAENWFQLIFDYPRLGKECAEREMSRGIDSEIDPDCPFCKYECLYGKRYGIRIRGHYSEFTQSTEYDGLWSCLKNVLFQCEK
ncbi:MAG: hypothetical protein O2818_00740 [Bacteroidetes bacterium]|nr:hypothetical protein [Bacteroidota bacterium]MDA1335389.1 hypothetical protein [Bacteroidota bacterium]